MVWWITGTIVPGLLVDLPLLFAAVPTRVVRKAIFLVSGCGCLPVCVPIHVVGLQPPTLERLRLRSMKHGSTTLRLAA